MPSNKFIPFGSAVLAAVMLFSCTKEFREKTPMADDLSDSATIKIFNASVSSVRNQLIINDVLTLRTVFAYNSTWPTSAANAGFVVSPGQKSIVIKDSNATSTQPVQNITLGAEAGKSYSIFLYDTVTAMKNKLVVNDIVIPADTTSRLRFANFSFRRATPAPAIDVYSFSRKQLIFTNVPLNDVTGYISYPSLTSDTLAILPAGTTDTLVKLNGYSTTPKRSYTLVFRGVYTVTGTGATARGVSSVTDY
ncbi:MAG: DUF4397 domain-containing protein [Chitinophagaceae bacterium]